MKIGDFAMHSGLSPDTIRYYERIGLLPRTVRDRGGRRTYGVDDLAWASFLRKLQAMDMPMRDRLNYSRLRANGSSTMLARREMLEAHRDIESVTDGGERYDRSAHGDDDGVADREPAGFGSRRRG